MELPAIVGIMIVAAVLVLVAVAASPILPFGVLVVMAIIGIIFLILVAAQMMS